MREFFRKLEPYVFYLFIFAIPFQARLIVARWTHPFNEWTSAYIFGTDILIFLLFILWAVRSFNSGNRNGIKESIAREFKPGFKNPNLWLAGFFIVSALSIFSSKIVGLSFYHLLKLAEFIALYFYFKNSLGKVFEFRKTLTVIIASGVFQAVIGIIQFLKQSSLGLRLLGESPLSINGMGVAVFIADFQKHLRAYGTMPHPNVLAAWLFLAVFALYNFYFYSRPDRGLKIHLPVLCAYAILLFGFFFTFSRVIVGLWVLGIVGRLAMGFFKKDFSGFFSTIKKHLVAVSIVTLCVVIFISAVYWPLVQSRLNVTVGEEAVAQRVFYNQIAASTAISNPLLGVGIGQFVPDMMGNFKYLPVGLYQPVHNIYLLIASEIGFVGLALFLLFLFFVFFNFIKRTRIQKPYQLSFLILVFSFLLMGLFDHFIWTLQQGSLVFWMSLALINVWGVPRSETSPVLPFAVRKSK